MWFLRHFFRSACGSARNIWQCTNCHILRLGHLRTFLRRRSPRGGHAWDADGADIAPRLTPHPVRATVQNTDESEKAMAMQKVGGGPGQKPELKQVLAAVDPD